MSAKLEKMEINEVQLSVDPESVQQDSVTLKGNEENGELMEENNEVCGSDSSFEGVEVRKER